MRNYDELIKKHADSITGKKDFLLGVRVKVDNPNPYPYEECINDPAKALETALSFLRPSLEIKSDFIPCLYPIPNRMVYPVPSMFGCPMKIVSDDVWAVPIISDIEQVWDMEVPPLNQGIMPKVVEHLEYYQRYAPPEIPVIPPSEQSPFVVAYMLRGDDIYLDMYDHPEELARLLELVTEAFIKVERYYKKILDEDSHYRVSFENFFVPGLRIAADSNVNLAPEFIKQFEMPYLERIAKEFGSLAIHYCGDNNLPGYQFADVLSEYDFVKLIHTQMGVYLDDRNVNRLRHHFKIASIWKIPDIGEFIDKNIKKLRQSQGAAFFVEVESKEKAKDLVRKWLYLRDTLLR